MPAAVKTLVHAFISSRLDYCNQLFVGVTGRLLDKLQSLQNAAARLVTGTRKFDHITPVMRELHWLPVRQRIRFKTAVLVFKCFHGLSLAYLCEYCKFTTGRSHLRLANHWRWSLLGRTGREPPTFWLLWAASISDPPTFLGDVNFFFLYIAVMTGENLQ